MAKDSPRYVAEELVRGAEAQGTPVSRRLLTDWVSLGLLDQPTRRGLGRGKGTSATWSYNQYRLFLITLQKRQEVERVKTLCNLPVMAWLYWGPDYASVEQVRRAMKTFATSTRTASGRVSRETGKRVADQLAGPGLRREDRTALVEAIVDALGGGTLDTERLREAARRVFDRGDTGRVVGPQGAQMRVDAWVRIVEANLAGTESLASLTDAEFEDARLAHHHAMATYSQRQPEFAQDPEIGAAFDAPTPDFLANNACSQLLTTIGFLQLARRNAPPEND